MYIYTVHNVDTHIQDMARVPPKKVAKWLIFSNRSIFCEGGLQ